MLNFCRAEAIGILQVSGSPVFFSLLDKVRLGSHQEPPFIRPQSPTLNGGKTLRHIRRLLRASGFSNLDSREEVRRHCHFNELMAFTHSQKFVTAGLPGLSSHSCVLRRTATDQTGGRDYKAESGRANWPPPLPFATLLASGATESAGLGRCHSECGLPDGAACPDKAMLCRTSPKSIGCP